MPAIHAASGALFGLAFGDAVGKDIEFTRYDTIVERYGSSGPRQLPIPALVTDDTQMALVVARALIDYGPPPYDTHALTTALRVGFVDWSTLVEGWRAPGTTCMTSCYRLQRSPRTPWQRLTQGRSKGNGANMRVAPVALVPGLSDHDMAGIAQLQAAITHGHPTALAASELTALAVRLAAEGITALDVVDALHKRCQTRRTVYREDVLGDLASWLDPGRQSNWIAFGWDECREAIERLWEALSYADDGGDACAHLGARGGTAEDCLILALYCAVRHPGDPVTAIARACATSGDSDTIAAVTGAIVGATHGLDAWPAGWAERIEYADQLAEIGEIFDAIDLPNT
ncbi:ADP-ribosylglycohydrolase family protein [Micromonospora lupini]|uniref:ADP-ribosylglycohydrolase family protein n=1 Tax=Micromonospora lupini TaxID=285679 RepID=UPI0022547B81|nr:ADP-ribosylglycohydrolase family protein [Micromonospora lupini]MCX5070916.1 ADP-ribosylglycohydrolase family protein [Micromonospora lupini]